MFDSKRYSEIKAEAIKLSDKLSREKKERIDTEKAKGISQLSAEEISKQYVKMILNDSKFCHEPKPDIPKHTTNIKTVTLE